MNSVERPEVLGSEDILGYGVTTCTMQDVAQAAVSCVERTSGPCWLACLNPHSYAVACRDSAFAKALHEANWLLPDGTGVVIASRLLGGRIRERLSGPDAFLAISSALDARGSFRAMFLGSTDATLAKIAKRYSMEFPRAVLIATYSPPFRSTFDGADLEAIRTSIKEASPDVLWVGLGAPKQEILLSQLGPDAGYRLAAAVGAAFDFYAGTVTRSSPLFRRLGLEWLPRLVQEPRRLWRRMFLSAPLFLAHVLAKAWSRRRTPR